MPPCPPHFLLACFFGVSRSDLFTVAGSRFARSSTSFTYRSYSTNKEESTSNSGGKLKWLLIGAGTTGGGLFLWKKISEGNSDLAASLSSRDGANTTTADTPGGATSNKKHALVTASHIMQGFSPLKSIHLNVCGVHHYAGDVADKKLIIFAVM